MSDYEREILLCVSGLSPQIITETVYAMAVQGTGGERIVPDEIHVVTTTTGRDLIREKLLAPENGHLLALRRDYALGARAALPENNIHLITDADGEPLDDIRNDDDNTAVANLLTRLIQQFTQDSATRLHVSIAGGRKTMGFYAGYALSLYGRAWDRLSHVLVNKPFESREFYYPQPQPQDINVGTKAAPEWANTRDARISLGYIPVVRMRDGLGEAVLHGTLDFSDAVDRAQQMFEPPRLLIDLDYRKVYVQGMECHLSPREFLWLYWMARRVQDGNPDFDVTDPDIKDGVKAALDYLEGTGDSDLQRSWKVRWFNANNGELRVDKFANIRTRINDAVKGLNLSSEVEKRYLIQSDGKNRNKHYWLHLEPEQVEIKGTP